MKAPSLRTDPDRAWSAYEPAQDGPWDLDRVGHLHRRAGFCASWGTLQRDRDDGPAASIDRLLMGEPRSLDGTPAAEFDRLVDRMAASAGALPRLQASWLYRMIFTPHPLKERMTLFWHGHFATSDAKVKNVLMMRRQNDLLRLHALGDFAALLAKMGRDPAMLVWLDCTANRKAHPNENYAREVMELFTLGRGRYTEMDIREAARAYTGGFIRDDQYAEISSQHDDGDKAILGQSGRFRGDDVTRILLDQPSCAEFLCSKLYAHFVSEVEAPGGDLIRPLAEAFRRSNYDIRTPVAMILRSKLFHDPATRRKRVKSPIEFAIGSLRALEVLSPTASADALADACDRMGQAPYLPPSVAGWDGGAAWINTTTSLARSNFALGLVGKDARGIGGRFDAKALADRHRAKDAGQFFRELLVQDGFRGQSRSPQGNNAPEAATLVLAAPEYQLA